MPRDKLFFTTKKAQIYRDIGNYNLFFTLFLIVAFFNGQTGRWTHKNVIEKGIVLRIYMVNREKKSNKKQFPPFALVSEYGLPYSQQQ